jgi:hypothetical protein
MLFLIKIKDLNCLEIFVQFMVNIVFALKWILRDL